MGEVEDDGCDNVDRNLHEIESRYQLISLGRKSTYLPSLY